MKWEYWVKELDHGAWETELDELGRQGWELVTIYNGRMYFKRLINV